MREPEPTSARRGRLRARTPWARSAATPLRDFLNAETGGAVVLLAATLVALGWANSPWRHSYESVWTTTLTIRLGHSGVSQDLRHCVNDGLMTFFFLVLGLEAKREFDIGQMRERRRLAIPPAGARHADPAEGRLRPAVLAAGICLRST